MTITIHGYNPGLKSSVRKLPDRILREMSNFTESESSPREARASDIAHTFGISVSEVLNQLDSFQEK